MERGPLPSHIETKVDAKGRLHYVNTITGVALDRRPSTDDGRRHYGQRAGSYTLDSAAADAEFPPYATLDPPPPTKQSDTRSAAQSAAERAMQRAQKAMAAKKAARRGKRAAAGPRSSRDEAQAELKDVEREEKTHQPQPPPPRARASPTTDLAARLQNDVLAAVQGRVKAEAAAAAAARDRADSLPPPPPQQAQQEGPAAASAAAAAPPQAQTRRPSAFRGPSAPEPGPPPTTGAPGPEARPDGHTTPPPDPAHVLFQDIDPARALPPAVPCLSPRLVRAPAVPSVPAVRAVRPADPPERSWQVRPHIRARVKGIFARQRARQDLELRYRRWAVVHGRGGGKRAASTPGAADARRGERPAFRPDVDRPLRAYDKPWLAEREPVGVESIASLASGPQSPRGMFRRIPTSASIASALSLSSCADAPGASRHLERARAVREMRAERHRMATDRMWLGGRRLGTASRAGSKTGPEAAAARAAAARARFVGRRASLGTPTTAWAARLRSQSPASETTAGSAGGRWQRQRQREQGSGSASRAVWDGSTAVVHERARLAANLDARSAEAYPFAPQTRPSGLRLPDARVPGDTLARLGDAVRRRLEAEAEVGGDSDGDSDDSASERAADSGSDSADRSDGAADADAADAAIDAEERYGAAASAGAVAAARARRRRSVEAGLPMASEQRLGTWAAPHAMREEVEAVLRGDVPIRSVSSFTIGHAPRLNGSGHPDPPPGRRVAAPARHVPDQPAPRVPRPLTRDRPAAARSGPSGGGDRRAAPARRRVKPVVSVGAAPTPPQERPFAFPAPAAHVPSPRGGRARAGSGDTAGGVSSPGATAVEWDGRSLSDLARS